MRQLLDQEIEKIKILTENSVELCLIEPTQTGLQKSIMDATGSVRTFLKSKNIHDFTCQGQGQENKVLIDSILVTSSVFIPSSASLYRPNTKKGDPRIWFKGLGQYSNANDILGIIENEGVLYVLNITQMDLGSLLNGEFNNPLKELILEIRTIKHRISDELLFKLREISKAGFVKSLVNSDTGVGRTLEHLLGISMNSSKQPDYKGIELKSSRESKTNRKSLFAKTPNWELSKFKSRSEILDNFGYWDKGVFRLYTTARGTGRNAQGLILKIEYDKSWLLENSDKPEIGDFLVWELNVLKSALATKHKETFWISSESKKENDDEYFLYKSVKHTESPLVDQFEMLIEIGAITMDYPMKRMPDGKESDKGCNFKISQKYFDLLFPPSKIYDLLK